MAFTGLEIPPKDANMAKPNVAILWTREDLQGRAIQQLLITAKDWKIIKIYDETNSDLLVEDVERVNPAVVIIHLSDYAGRIMEMLNKLMMDHCEMKIIAISPDDNLVEVYNKQTVRIKEVSNLLSVIEEHTVPNTRR
jgi:DNA-binding NarL/FixJ family response regulator